MKIGSIIFKSSWVNSNNDKYQGDFEDYLQYFCAEKEGCCAIYTMDKKFPNLKIPVKRYGEIDI